MLQSALMADNPHQSFLRGLKAIEDAIDAECRNRGIACPMIRHNGGVGGIHDVRITIEANQRTIDHLFTREDIADSAESLPPLVRAQLRAFVTLLSKPEA